MNYDDKGMKWLRLRNWKKYQPDDRLRNKEARLPWIRDYTEKLENYDYLKLTIFQRGLFEGICLIAGTRPSRSLPNDPAWIARELHVNRAERSHVPRTLVALQEHGYLIATNTEKFFEDEDEFAVREGEREGEGDRKGEGSQSASKLASSASQDEEVKYLDEGIPVFELPCFELLHTEFGIQHRLQENIIRRVHTALVTLGKDESWMQGCIQFASQHKWWTKRVFNPLTLADALENGIEDPDNTKLPAQYNTSLAQRKAVGVGKR